MGFFSGQSKPDLKVELQALPTSDEHYEDLPEPPKPRSSTLITQGVTLSGKLFGEGVIQVDGVVEGEIDLKGSVTVSATGLIKGPITADVIRIAGCVEGNVTARSHLRLEKTGQMQGDVSTPSLVVEDGGRLDGRSTMIQPQPDESVSASASSDSLQFGPGYRVGEEENDLL